MFPTGNSGRAGMVTSWAQARPAKTASPPQGQRLPWGQGRQFRQPETQPVVQRVVEPQHLPSETPELSTGTLEDQDLQRRRRGGPQASHYRGLSTGQKRQGEPETE